MSAEDKSKLLKLLPKIEKNLLDSLRSMAEGDMDEVGIYMNLAKKSAEKAFELTSVANLVKQHDAIVNDPMPTAQSLVGEFKGYLAESKLIPYAKLACSVKDTLKLPFMSIVMGKEGPDSDEVKALDAICEVINQIDNAYDDSVEAMQGHMLSLSGLISNPLSLIEGASELVVHN